MFMRRLFFVSAMIVSSLLLISCETAPTTSNAKPANVSSNAAAAPAASANAEADIKKMLNDISIALSKNDADAMDKIYAADYSIINQDGSMQTRAERLASIKSGDIKYSSISFSDINVRTYGDTAVVIAVANIKATNKGKPIEGKMRVSSVWVKGKDGWRQVNAQTTTMSEPAKTDEAKKDDAK
jgi:ketosteroid isomerase-like protein